MITSPFTQDFCNYLEYHLSSTFRHSSDKKDIFFWCDGILMPDEQQLSFEIIKNKSEVVTDAWLGYDGQEKYKMVIKLGPCALSNYEKGQSLIECVPDERSLDWVNLDVDNKKIELHLQ